MLEAGSTQRQTSQVPPLMHDYAVNRCLKLLDDCQSHVASCLYSVPLTPTVTAEHVAGERSLMPLLLRWQLVSGLLPSSIAPIYADVLVLPPFDVLNPYP
jgi:hypothetical protein